MTVARKRQQNTEVIAGIASVVELVCGVTEPIAKTLLADPEPGVRLLEACSYKETKHLTDIMYTKFYDL